MATEIYVVMTSRQTWGKGNDPVIALFHACQMYDDIKQAQFYLFDFPEEKNWWEALLEVNVDGMGVVTYPKEVEVTDLGVMDIVGIPARLNTIKRKVGNHVSRKFKG